MSKALLGTDSPLRALRRQVRLVRRHLTVVVPQDAYYVQAECIAALRALGHRVVQVALGEEGRGIEVGEALGRLLRACAEHRPDMLLTINYTGFDRAAWFDELVEAMGLPVAVWFVDSPFFLAVGYLPPAPNVTTWFCWDESYVPVLRAHGAPRVAHLPLGTDPNDFAPSAAAEPKRYPLGFVGHTLDALVLLWGERHAACAGSDAPAEAQNWSRALQKERSCLHEFVPEVGAPFDVRVVRLAHANYLASRAYRQGMLAALPQAQLHVWGNDAWRTLLPRARHHGGTRYGAATAQVYRGCAVNVNLTNLQMPRAVNQRTFDVPAAGGFLLADAQPELSRYLEPGQEVATFASADELRDKAAYYTAHPAARAAIATAGRRRVLAEHTYVHRMQTLLDTMRAQHGPGARA